MKFRQRVATAVKILSNQSTNSLGSVLRNYSKQATFRPQDQVRGITYKAIDKIGQSLSVYEPKLQKPNGDFIQNHPLYNLAQQPNDRQHGSLFHHLEAMFYEIYGETFWYTVPGELTGKTKQIYLLNPAQMEVICPNGELVGYVLHKANGQQVPFDVEEIIHDKRPNPFNEWRGLSILEKAAIYVDTEIVTSQFTLNYIKNNASPSGIVSLPNMTKEAFQQFAMQWREGYEGPENAGKTAFIRGEEAKFQAVGATLQDIDQKITRDMAKDDVLLMFDVPKGLLGASGEKGLGRNELEPLEYIFAKYKIDPMMKRLDRIWGQIYANTSRSDGSKVVHATPIPDDKTFTLDRNKAGVDIWITRNEARESQGLEPVPGGDDLPPVNPTATMNTIESGKAGKAAKSEKEITTKIVLKKKLTKAEQIRKIREDQEQFRSELIKTNDIYADKIKGLIGLFSDEQEQIVINKLGTTAKSIEEFLFNIKEESEALAALLLPTIIELLETQTEDVASFIGGELITVSPEIRKVTESRIKQIAGAYNQDTIAALEKTLREGQAAGESLNKLKKRVEQTYSDAKGYRAERIARTESLRTSNRTAELTYSQNGFSQVQWLVNPGACEFCRTYAGRTKTIGTNFTSVGDVITGHDGGQMRIEYGDIDTPPLHPNCTCSLVPSGDSAILPDGEDFKFKPLGEEGFVRLPSRENKKLEVFHGDGANVNDPARDVFGDAFYVARDKALAEQYGVVSKLQLPFSEKQIYRLKTDDDFTGFLNAAQKHAVRTGGDLDPANYIPEYVRHLGYKAVEATEAVVPGGGIAVVDKKAIAALTSQM